MWWRQKSLNKKLEGHWRHARDCGCAAPGVFPCKRVEPEDPDWCPTHGWHMGLCCQEVA